MQGSRSIVISSNRLIRMSFCCLAGVHELRLEERGWVETLDKNKVPSERELNRLIKQLPDRSVTFRRADAEDILRKKGYLTRRPDSAVVGRWKDDLRRFYGPEDLLEDFTNWESSAQGVLRFTK